MAGQEKIFAPTPQQDIRMPDSRAKWAYLEAAEKASGEAQAATIKGLGTFAIDAAKGYMEAKVANAATDAARRLVNPDYGYVGEDIAEKSPEAKTAVEGMKALRLEKVDQAPNDPQYKKYVETIQTIANAKDSGILSPIQARTRVANEIKKWGAIMPGWLSDFQKTAAEITGVSDMAGLDMKNAFTFQKEAKESAAIKRQAEMEDWAIKKEAERLLGEKEFAGKTMGEVMAIATNNVINPTQKAMRYVRGVAETSAATSKAQLDEVNQKGKVTLVNLSSTFSSMLEANVDASGKPTGDGRIAAWEAFHKDVGAVVSSMGIRDASGRINADKLRNKDVVAALEDVKQRYIARLGSSFEKTRQYISQNKGNVPQEEFDKWMVAQEQANTDYVRSRTGYADAATMLSALKNIDDAHRMEDADKNYWLKFADLGMKMLDHPGLMRVTGKTTRDEFRREFPWAVDVYDSIRAYVYQGTGNDMLRAMAEDAKKDAPDTGDGKKLKSIDGHTWLSNGSEKPFSAKQKSDIMYTVSSADMDPATFAPLIKNGDVAELAKHLGGDETFAKEVMRKVTSRVFGVIQNPNTLKEDIAGRLEKGGTNDSYLGIALNRIKSVFGSTDPAKTVYVTENSDGSFTLSGMTFSDKRLQDTTVKSGDATHKSLMALKKNTQMYEIIQKKNPDLPPITWQAVLMSLSPGGSMAPTATTAVTTQVVAPPTPEQAEENKRKAVAQYAAAQAEMRGMSGTTTQLVKEVVDEKTGKKGKAIDADILPYLPVEVIMQKMGVTKAEAELMKKDARGTKK